MITDEGADMRLLGADHGMCRTMADSSFEVFPRNVSVWIIAVFEPVQLFLYGCD